MENVNGGPLPRNPEYLLRPVRIRAVGGFVLNREDVQPGQTVTVHKYLADSLIAAGRAERVN